MKKIISLILSLSMFFAVTIPVFAEELPANTAIEPIPSENKSTNEFRFEDVSVKEILLFSIEALEAIENNTSLNEYLFLQGCRRQSATRGK